MTLRKLRSPLKWHGGKSYLARRIIALMPEHRIYCEPFVGGGSVLLNKPKSTVEVAGDANAALIDFWRYLASDGWILKSLADGLSYDEENFALAADGLDSSNAGRRAISFLVRNRFSRGGLGEDFAWSDRLRGKRSPTGPVPGDINAWNTIRRDLPRIAERLAAVDFTCGDAVELIRSFDSADTLHYCDPPYLHSTRTVRDVYEYEMDEGQHAALLDRLNRCRGAAMLSGYRSDLYDRELRGWTRHEFDMPNHSGQGATKQRRLECLWIKEATP